MQDRKSNFGFKEVTSKEKRNLVDNLFSDIASKYDLMNDLMSLGIHRSWKDRLCRMIPNFNSTILDVASGTGDIAFRIKNEGKKRSVEPHIFACDINPEMLKICKNRAIDRNLISKFDFVIGDAEKLPFSDNSFDYYTIAFGIRNVVNIENVLSEAYRVLKPTGKFLCLEFSKVENDLMDSLYELYSFKMIPMIGKYITNNGDAYKYLSESISIFPNQEEFKGMIQDTGFKNVSYTNLTFGVAAIHYGYKI